jgi:D-tyrosyl-tRNA(Tyr) deacylase
MKAVLQRASYARVEVAGEEISSFGELKMDNPACGLLILLGVQAGDTKADVDYLVQKASELRIFDDKDGKINLSVLEAGARAIVVSQFTLLADCKSGRRPGFTQAARPEEAEPLYMYFVEQMRKKGLEVGTGKFGAHMNVTLNNSGPVTILLEARGGKPV